MPFFIIFISASSALLFPWLIDIGMTALSAYSLVSSAATVTFVLMVLASALAMKWGKNDG